MAKQKPRHRNTKTPWVFQTDRDVKCGNSKGNWYVGWFEGSVKKRRMVGTTDEAERYAARMRLKLLGDLHDGPIHTNWQDFRREYEREVLSKKRLGTQVQVKLSLDRFAELMEPGALELIDKQTIDQFIGKRQEKITTQYGKPISDRTVNKDLRHVHKFLQEAEDRNHIARVPKFAYLSVDTHLPIVMPEEVFHALFKACGAASGPADQCYTSKEWWRAYLYFVACTGWRAREPLSVLKEHVDWKARTVELKAEASKTRKARIIHIPPELIPVLRKVVHTGPELFPWPYNPRHLHRLFHQIQDAAGTWRENKKGHRKMYWRFHDLRRSYITNNLANTPPEILAADLGVSPQTMRTWYFNPTDGQRTAAQHRVYPKLNGQAG